MHEVTLPNGDRVKDKWLKWLRVAAYLLMTAAGVLLLLSPVLTEIYETTARVMSGFLILGGGLSFVGALFQRWWGEYTGLPLLATSFLVFALITVASTWENAPYLAVGNFCLLTAVALGLMARWRDARAIYRLAVFLAKNPPEEVLDV